jgi:predicted GNAT family N-acyltransferase
MSHPLTVTATKELRGAELAEVLRHAPWAKQRNLIHLEQMIRGSLLLVTARRAQRLVGFGRAWGDGVYRAVLDDVVVTPEERGNGVGKSIIECLLRECQQIEELSLTCRDEMTTFYEQFGFRRHGGAHMIKMEQ